MVQNGVVPDEEARNRKRMLELPRLSVVGGVLWYSDSARGSRARLVALRQKFLEEAHSGPYAGHFVVKGMYEQLAHRYWWPGMCTIIAEPVLRVLPTGVEEGEASHH